MRRSDHSAWLYLKAPTLFPSTHYRLPTLLLAVMSRSPAVAWLRRVCLTDYGYTFALPALAIASTVLSQAVIRRIAFTEIDFQTYLGQAALFLQGERNYANSTLKEEVDLASTPLCTSTSTPSFTGLRKAESTSCPHRTSLPVSDRQRACRGAVVPTSWTSTHRCATCDPVQEDTFDLSATHVQRPIAILCVYLALFAAINARWKFSALLFSLGLGIKMNVLLFLPRHCCSSVRLQRSQGSHVVHLDHRLSTSAHLIPFTLHNAQAYLSRAFDFSRAFLYVWTVNWRFVSEETFLSQPFAKSLLALHLGLLVLFGLFRWTAITSEGPQWIFQNLGNKSQSSISLRRWPSFALLSLPTSWASFAREVCIISSTHGTSIKYHYCCGFRSCQSCSACSAGSAGMVLEYVPSTELSSQVLLAIHVLLVLGCFTLPGLVAPTKTVAAEPVEDEEGEVDSLLLTDDARAGRKQTLELVSDTESIAEDEAAEEAERLERIAAAREAKAAKGSKAARCIPTPYRYSPSRAVSIGRGSLLLRPLLVLLGLVLMFVVLTRSHLSPRERM